MPSVHTQLTVHRQPANILVQWRKVSKGKRGPRLTDREREREREPDRERETKRRIIDLLPCCLFIGIKFVVKSQLC